MNVLPVSVELGATPEVRRPPVLAPSGTAFPKALAAARPNETSAPVHTVSRGDTLSGICLDYLRRGRARPSQKEIYAAVQQVADANGIANPDLIFVGQELDLSVLGARVDVPAVPVASAEPTPSITIPGVAEMVQTTLPKDVMDFVESVLHTEEPSAALARPVSPWRSVVEGPALRKSRLWRDGHICFRTGQ